MSTSEPRRAILYRMVMDDHVCPYGIKSKWLLERKGFEVEDHHLETREETDAFKAEHDVETTPQTFIEGQRVGGYGDLREYFGKASHQDDEQSYQPVLAVFAVAGGAAAALSWAVYRDLTNLRMIEWFVALAMAMLAMLKLQDVRSFSTMFLNYDLLARRWVPYGFIYPFAEAIAALLMLSGALTFVSAPLALVIGTIGAVSVIKAVWVEGREIKCACVGGGSKVPLGFVSLTENLAMIAMGIWMPLKDYVLDWS
jgi:glutaredoxin